MSRPVRLLISVLFLCGPSAAWGGPPSEIWHLRNAQILVDDAPQPPPDDDPRWRPVALPDRRPRARSESGEWAWYRLELPDLPAKVEQVGIELTTVQMNAAVYLNGHWLGDGGRFEEPISRNLGRPLYFSFSRALLGRPVDVVHVRLFAPAFGRAAALGEVRVGAHAALSEVHARDRLVRVEVARTATMLGLAGVLMAGALWLASRQRAEYGYAALAVLAWTLGSADYWVRDPLVSSYVWERLVGPPIDWIGPLIVPGAYRLCGLARPRLERAALAYAGAATLVAALVPRPWLIPVVDILHLGSVTFAATGVLVYLRYSRDKYWVERTGWLIAGLFSVVFAIHDELFRFGLLAPDQLRLFPLMIFFNLVAFGGTLLNRFARVLRRAEEQNLELEARGRALEQEQLIARERERIMREMHDGMGAALISALSLAESGRASGGEIAGVVREALVEMRVVIDSIDPAVTDLNTLLAALRGRFAPLLDRAGMRFAWRVEDLPPLAPRERLHVLRVVQEAVTNALRHAKAREIEIASGSRTGERGEPGFFVRIADDGIGPPAQPRLGRGLANMQSRARELGGRLTVAAAMPGTIVDLWVPAPQID